MQSPVLTPTFCVLGILLLLASVVYSEGVPLGLLALELPALGLLLMALWQPQRVLALPRLQLWALGALVALPLLYLLPLPASLGAMLPGREHYAAAISLATGGEVPGPTTLSLYPQETLDGLLTLLIPVAVFLSARTLSTQQLQALCLLVFGLAAFQAVTGLVQYGGALQGIALFERSDSASGTYTSRNNFAGFLLLVLMPALALLVATVGRGRTAQSSLRERVVFWSTLRGHRAFGFAALALVLLLGIVFSRSRAGISLTMLGVLLVGVLLSRRVGGRQGGFGPVSTVASVAVGLAVAIGLAPVLQRFTLVDPVEDGRVTIFSGTLEGIGQFLPLGAGPATFQQAFAPFQDLSQSQYLINQAHNSYLEWLFDGGIPALLAMALLLFVYLSRWPKVWAAGEWGEFRYVQVGCGLGLGLMLLHEFVDYNLFVPANMVYLAFFAAVFLHEYREPAPAPRRARDSARSERSLPPLQPPEALPATNPFMD